MNCKRRDAVSPNIEKKIIETLSQIEEEYDVKILHAVESGSRAWGFHSPNSDYDVRFFYVHKQNWYLSIYPGRDVIELPINETYDVSGWDLKKTLHLAMKSNAVVMEWLQSPIPYKTDPHFSLALQEFCAQAFDEKALMYHYINLGKRQIDQTWRTTETAQIKKYFYMIRPAMALRWLEHNVGAKSMPMNIQDLMRGSEVPEDIQACINSLIEQKKSMVEKEKTSRIRELDNFIYEEYSRAEERASNLPKKEKEVSVNANQFFQEWLL